MTSEFIPADCIPIELRESPQDLDPITSIINDLFRTIINAKNEVEHQMYCSTLNDSIEPLYWMKTALNSIGGLEHQVEILKTMVKEGYESQVMGLVEANVWTDGDFEIRELPPKVGPRKVNVDLFKKMYAQEYAALLLAKKKTLEQTYKPTIQDVDVTLGKQRAASVMIPGEVIDTGYDIVPRRR